MLTHPLFRIVYTSQFSRDSRYEDVLDILVASRRFNVRNQISGLLVFDGERFGQCLEGDRNEVTQLMRRIERDSRHHDVQIVSKRSIEDRQFKTFNMGYAAAEHADLLNMLEGMSPDEAFQVFLSLASSLEYVTA